ncbi:MAG TPA: S8 family serine peptidase [Phycisphaerales bacterium]|nr:S8 family serine peptidase [Phycisphaerales bacterium]
MAGLVILACGQAQVAGAVGVGGEGGYHRYYFKQPVAMQLDATRIAVRARTADALATALRGAGVAAARVQQHERAEWQIVTVQNQTAAGMEAMVGKLAAQPGIDFASPVFVNEYGPQWLAGDLVVGYNTAQGVPDGVARDAVVRAAGMPLLAQRDFMPAVDRHNGEKNGFRVLAAANALAVVPGVAFAEADMIVSARNEIIPNDTFFGNLWGIHNTGQSGGTADQDMDGPEAWDITTGSNSIIVNVLDTGTQLNHPDLNLAPGLDPTGAGTNGGPGNVCDNHGTAVSSCVSAFINNNLGVVGIAPTCRVASVRVFVSSLACDGSGSVNFAQYATGVNYAGTNGGRVTVASLSLGGMSATIDTAYANQYAAGVVHFAATGNSGAGSIAYPASAPNVNGVGAVDRNGNRAGFSQFGTGTDFTAPGVAIDACDRTGTAGYVNGDYVGGINGTSFATPYAAGVAALILSQSPGMTAAQVEARMQTTAVDRGPAGYDTEYGHGFVNARNALQNPVPGNDTCGAAINVSAGGTFNGTLLGATNDAAAGACGLATANPDVWYRFTANAYTTLTVNTCGTNDTPSVDAGIDTVLTLHSACGGAELGCSDDFFGCAGAAGALRDSQLTRSMAPNETVYIRVSKYGTFPTGPFILNVTSTPTAPPNDGCSPIDVSAGGTYYGSLIGATNNGTASCGSSASNPDVWYSYTNGYSHFQSVLATTCGTHDANGINTGIDTVLSMHSACGGADSVCNDDTNTCGGLDTSTLRDSAVSRTIAPGETVYIRVSKFSTGAVGQFRLNITGTNVAPSNDACSAPIDVSAGGTFYGTLNLATSDDAVPSCGGSAGNPETWYIFANGGAPSTFTATTCGTHDGPGVDLGIDTVLSLRSACGVGDLTCNDDNFSCGSLDTSIFRDSSVGWALAPGEVVLIRVSKYFTSAVGPFRLNITNTPTGPVCDSTDFNGDGLFPDTADIDDFLSVFSGGPCSTGTCGDTDFNNDGLFPDTTDIDSLLSVFSGGPCF